MYADKMIGLDTGSVTAMKFRLIGWITDLQLCLVIRDEGKDPPSIAVMIFFFFSVWCGVASGGNTDCGRISTESFTKTLNG